MIKRLLTKIKPVKKSKEVAKNEENSDENDNSKDILVPVITEKGDFSGDLSIGETEYAILKSITFGFNNLKKISNALQIRAFVAEKHIINLKNEKLLTYYELVSITTKGMRSLEIFENNNPLKSKPIEDFLIYTIEKNKKRRLMIQKIFDIVQLLSIIILIIVTIYFGLII